MSLDWEKLKYNDILRKQMGPLPCPICRNPMQMSGSDAEARTLTFNCPGWYNDPMAGRIHRLGRKAGDEHHERSLTILPAPAEWYFWEPSTEEEEA
jgi:hypothetical protein